MSTEGNELSLWLSWKRVADLSRRKIQAEVLATSPLSEPELTVLSHLEATGGSRRQNALAVAMGWDRTRLSHLLSRMEERGLLSRMRLRNGAETVLLDRGRQALDATKAPLAAAVHEYFASRLTLDQLAVLRDIIAALDE